MDVKQLVRVIQRSSPSGENPAFRPANSLAFPATCVINYQNTKIRPRLELSFLGLYGVSSPLPHYFITDALDEENLALREFLGIFNQIFYLAYFYAWQQKNPHLFQDSALRGHEMINSLAAIPSEQQETFSHVASFLMRARPCFHGLKALILAVIPDIPFHVEMSSCEWSPMLTQARLGKGRLSDDLILGQRIATQGQRLKIRLGPVSEVQARQLSPSGSLGKLLLKAVNQYLNHTKKIDLDLRIVYERPHCRLGQGLSLGWNAFLNTQHSSISKHYKP